MITLKDNQEITLMREAGRIVAIALEEVRKAIKPGISTKELDDIAYKVITEHNATPSFKGYNMFPASICTSINEVLVHGIPDSNIQLKDGDIISIDIGACYKGYHGDAARTYPCGNVSIEKLKLIQATIDTLNSGLQEIKPGNHLMNISYKMYEYAINNSYKICTEYSGHGIGKDLHESPVVPNVGEYGKGPLLRSGMTLAIEPVLMIGSGEIEVLEDNLTVVTTDLNPAAHHEQTILVTDSGYEILTKL